MGRVEVVQENASVSFVKWNFLAQPACWTISGPHLVTADTCWNIRTTPRNIQNTLQGGSTAPFEILHLRRLAKSRIPWVRMGPPGTQPCPQSPGEKLSADLPSREASEEASGRTNWFVGQPPGCTVPEKSASENGGVSKRESHDTNGLKLLPLTLCPGAGPWASCPG